MAIDFSAKSFASLVVGGNNSVNKTDQNTNEYEDDIDFEEEEYDEDDDEEEDFEDDEGYLHDRADMERSFSARALSIELNKGLGECLLE